MYRYRTIFPSDEPLDINLHVDENGEPLIPFADFVELASKSAGCGSSSVELATTFPRWSNLPCELQLRIYDFCDTATLFRLMQTCSNIRSEAKRRFWSNPKLWYPIPGSWITDGYLSRLQYPAAGIHIQQVEIGFGTMDPRLDPDSYYSDPQRRISAPSQAEAEARRFALKVWATFQRLFPSARRVIMTETFPNKFWQSTLAFTTLARACPSTIDVQVSGWEYSDSLLGIIQRTRELRRLVEAADGTFNWEKVPSEQTRRRISLPPKKVMGPLGAWQDLVYRENMLLQQQWAIRVLRLETVERFHFGERDPIPFACPYPDCYQRFEKAGAWTLHAIGRRHDQIQMSTQSAGATWAYRAAGALPAEVERPFQHKEKWLGREAAGLRVEKRNIQYACGKSGSIKRRRFREAFVSQLVNDLAYEHDDGGDLPTATALWDTYQRTVWDPHWISA